MSQHQPGTARGSYSLTMVEHFVFCAPFNRPRGWSARVALHVVCLIVCICSNADLVHVAGTAQPAVAKCAAICGAQHESIGV
jgi:hypothetical protein